MRRAATTPLASSFGGATAMCASSFGAATRRAPSPGLAAVLLAATLAGCGGPKGDPRLVPVEGIRVAAEERDAEGVVGFLDAGYRDVEGHGPKEVQEALKRWFFAYDDLKVTLTDVKVEPGPDGAARATFRAALSGSPRQIGGLSGLVPRSTAYRFEVRLVPSDKGWRIAWASWRQDE